MCKRVRNSVTVMLGVTLALTAFSPGYAKATTAEQAQLLPAGTFDLSARKRHYHHRHDNGRAALRMFSATAGSAAAVAAAHEARRQWGLYGIFNYYDGYEIQAPSGAYYGYGSSYGPYHPIY